jgi:predicted nucleotidyltransferase
MKKNKNPRVDFLKIVQMIIRECHPKKVILFGSYASGQQTKDSDLDILIVDDKLPDYEGIYGLRRKLLEDLSLPIQLLWLSDEEFTETKNVIGGIAYPAAKYGKVLYEKS